MYGRRENGRFGVGLLTVDVELDEREEDGEQFNNICRLRRSLNRLESFQCNRGGGIGVLSPVGLRLVWRMVC